MDIETLLRLREEDVDSEKRIIIRVCKTIDVELDEISETDFEGFLDILSERSTDSPLLQEISYLVTGHLGNTLQVCVWGKLDDGVVNTQDDDHLRKLIEFLGEGNYHLEYV